MVEQRIYIPYATDNWLVWVRIPPGVPILFLSIPDVMAACRSPKPLVGVRVPGGTPNLLVKDYDPGGLVREISLCRKRRRIGRFKRLDSFRDT